MVLNVNDFIKSWDKGGKNDCLKLCKAIIQESPSSEPLCQNKELRQALYSLCNSFLSGGLKEDQLTATLIDLVNLHNDVSSLLADILYVMDVETLCVDDKTHRDRYFTLVNNCSKQKIVTDYLLKERMEFDTLIECLSSFKNSAVAKFIKVKTRLFYKQQKFNLFREESEGYAKLVAELNQDIGESMSCEQMLQIVTSLIGCFNLDPNRVLDVILESLECHLDRADFYVGLIRLFLPDVATVSQLVAFRYGWYRDSEETPESLHQLAAVLLQHKLLPLDQIFHQLAPSATEMAAQHKQDLQEARAAAKKLSSTMLVSEEEAAAAASQGPEESGEIGSLGSGGNTNNQKVGLCAALIELGVWETAEKMISQMPEHYATAHPIIAQRLSSLLHYTIDPVYIKQVAQPTLKKPQPPRANSPPQAHTFEQFRQLGQPMVLLLGCQLYRDPVLMMKVARLCQCSQSQDHWESTTLDILDQALLPALSLLDANCCMAESLWQLVKLLPYHRRFLLYSRWKNDSHLHHPLLIRAKANALKNIRYIMKRLSKDNVKPSGRQIGKVSHSAPAFLFDYVLIQIQVFDNLIGPVVDSLKFLTSLSYDVLSYCVIEALANPSKEKTKHTGTTISPWLQSLSSFCGSTFKKYPIELTGLLQYVFNQQMSESSVDLLVLKEVIQKMGGIDTLEEMTEEHLEALSGGELLRAEAGYFTQIRNTKKSSARLKEALLEQELALPLCILMAQQRHCIVFRESGTHLKLVSTLYDQTQDTLVQLGTFLPATASLEEYTRRVPPLPTLLGDFHIHADVAFFLARPALNYLQNAKYEEVKKQDKGFKNLSASQKLQKYTEAVQLVTAPLVEDLRPLYPPKVWDDLSPQFYMTFWCLSMYDLHVPSASYEKEINKLKQLIMQVDENKDLTQSKKKKEKERCHALIEKLAEEERKQQEHCARVQARLKAEKDSWFHSRSPKNETVTQFLQLCVFPRCVFTPLDALFCSRFVHLLHSLKTPNFSTLICYDRILCDITYTMTLCTENEASRYGRFLCGVLETVMRWHGDKANFEKECSNFPGFMTKFRIANQPSDNSTDHVDFENYRHVCYKWHFKITKALLFCLESGDYVQIRNSLVVMTEILPYYPLLTNLGVALEKRVEKIKAEQKDKRPDIHAKATMYAGRLKMKKSTLVPEPQFHQKEQAPVKNKHSSKAAPPQDNGEVASKPDPKSESAKTTAKSSNAPKTIPPPAAKKERVDPEEPPPPPLVIKEEPTPSESSHRRSAPDHSLDQEKEHKRRRVENKSPRLDDSVDFQQVTERTDKSKSKKSARKREYLDENSESNKRKKEEEGSKSSKQRSNGDAEQQINNNNNSSSSRESRNERHRRDGSSPKSYERRRGEREEKKHHRSSSGSKRRN